MTQAEHTATVHRADYTLERGIWRATCRVCGHTVTDQVRRRAASAFRVHIRELAEIETTAAGQQSMTRSTVDLRDHGRPRAVIA